MDQNGCGVHQPESAGSSKSDLNDGEEKQLVTSTVQRPIRTCFVLCLAFFFVYTANLAIQHTHNWSALFFIFVQANKPKIKKKERLVEEKRGKNPHKTNHIPKKKRKKARNACEQWDKGWIHVICVHDTTHLAVITTGRGNWHSRRKNERSR